MLPGGMLGFSNRQGGPLVARKKSRSKGSRFGSRGSFRSKMLWLLMTTFAGASVGGYLYPDLPVVGPLVNRLIHAKVAVETSGSADARASVSQLSGYLSREGSGGRPAIGIAVPSSQAAHQRSVDKLLIASFNIQVFGQSKLAKRDVMSVLVNSIRQFDLVAIQEIRGKGDNILPDLVAMLNSDGSRYEFVIGPRLGRSVSTEQYAFVFDANRIECDPTSIGTIEDPRDRMHREPLVARFRPRTAAPDRAFSFWLVNTHTDPDEVPQEIAALADVFEVMQRARPYEDDVILLGDLNASESQMGRFSQMPGIHWVVAGGVATNTRQTKAYDNIVFHAPSTREYTGRWGVLNFESSFNLSREQALRVSDHLPVWAEFDVWEAASQRRAETDPAVRR